MTVQTKILLLLLSIVATLVGGLAVLKIAEERKFHAIASAREAERNRNFDEFLADRGDNLNVLVEDSSTWNDMVRAVVKEDRSWAEQTINDELLATYKANAVWIYKADGSLFFSRNNRFDDQLRELPLPPGAMVSIFQKERVCHFFIQVPQGWMEIRGSTIHPSIDGQRETKPQGYFFAGHIWIDDNIRRMSLFTGYEIHIAPMTADGRNASSEEQTGLIKFTRVVPGWDGKPIARIVVRNDSPLIRELNEASRRLFVYLLVFAGVLFLTLWVSLILWVRRPLRQLTAGLQRGDPEILAPLRKAPNEFGKLAELILKFRRTEEALHDAEERLRHAQKLEAVGRLAGGVAHDFNNLLTAIIGYSELLEARLAGDAVSREFVHVIHQAGDKAAGLTRQLLAFSRRQLLQPKVLDLNAVVCEMQKLLQRVIGEHIRFQIETRAEDARVLADPLQLEQVILNLGVNARDAMPGGGTLTVATENRTVIEAAHDGAAPAAGYVVLIVSDTGSGMDEQTKQRIFEPFFTTKGPGKGTGLGLATVYGIVKQSGGGIIVESELEKGSRFLIYLPRETGPIEEPALPVPVPPSLHAETILVVEDEEVVRQLVCAVLEDAGYEVLCAELPSVALHLAAEYPGRIDLLLTDVVMPEMHGPAVARLLTVSRPEMKVLYVSGYSDNDISDQGVLDPSLDVLQKPFTQQILISKVRELLDGLTAAQHAGSHDRELPETRTTERSRSTTPSDTGEVT
jgi:signal transduction histidine kinase/CheY-like chemotaxis protein